MKKFVLLAVLISVSAFAQTSPVKVTGPTKTEIDLALTKMAKAQAEARATNAETKAVMEGLQADFDKARADYNEAINKARKELKLPDEATFNPQDFSFTLPNKAAEKPKK